ncbi:hypothetical protein PTKIN_Ptkin06aG0159000 [Pterospermum kingtungense]
MRISECNNVEEIIQGSDEEVKDEISFPKLNRLELKRLTKLESFCSSGNHTFGLPSLATLIVESCPKMKMFCQGNLNSPMLHKVVVVEYNREGIRKKNCRILLKMKPILHLLTHNNIVKNSKEDELNPPSTAKK